MKDFLIIDLETTGLNPASDKIIEIAGLYIAGGYPIGSFEILVNPMCNLPLKITQITGITNAMVAGQPTIYDIYDDIHKKLGDYTLVGYNIDGFDKLFLDNISLEMDGKKLENRTYDILPVMRNMFPGGSHSLISMCDRFGIEYNAHRAGEDCMALYKLMKATNLLN